MFSISQVFLEASDLSKQHIMSYLNKDVFLAYFVYLILSQKILVLTSNIKNVIFF
jgi:hypothetical protein